ncbi:hypothetical protein LEN26_001464 [Aphanomyces euteiches]|nr:hypothetical protein AeMF1_017700 [Aphanomyces euteiches]KAH9161354.1 hypothetical protein LEN26_001464 [Aphanomyces euteiches]KAH9188244.1 hypothetical protein AeNC1_009783 [Aphanomyces euteiches]
MHQHSRAEMEQELRLLFATDEQLRKDLVAVYELFSDTSSEDDPRPETEMSLPQRQVNQSRERQKREIKRLRHEVDALSADIASRHQARTTRVMSEWEQVARDELQAANDARREQQELLGQVQDNATFIDDMVQVLRKKPRLIATDVQSDAWRQCKLAAQASLRVAAIHAIADREYSRMQSAFVRAGILDRWEDLVRTTPIVQPVSQKLLLEYATVLTLPAPFNWVGPAVWKVFRGDYDKALRANAQEIWERLDEHTAYSAFQAVEGDASAHSNFVAKHYAEPTREVVVWRSVLQDELMPRMATGTVHDEWGSLVVLKVDEHTCCIKSLMYIAAGEAIPSERVQAPIEVTENCRDTLDMMQMPLVDKEEVPFALKTFYERGRELEIALKAAVEEVIAKYQTMLHTRAA